MNLAEHFRMMHNFAKNNPDHPDSLWFIEKFPDYDPENETVSNSVSEFRKLIETREKT